MLHPDSIKLKNSVRVSDETSKFYKQIGIIIFIEEKKGFRNSWNYAEMTVRFTDGDALFKPWSLTDVIEPVDDLPDENSPKKSKTKPLTKIKKSSNIITVPDEQSTSTNPKDNTMSLNSSVATDTVTTTETVKSPRGRKVNANSSNNQAIAIVRAMPVDQRTSKEAIQKIVDVLSAKGLTITHGTAQVYYYNAIKTLRSTGEHPEFVAKLKKATKPRKVPTAMVDNPTVDQASGDTVTTEVVGSTTGETL